MTGLRHPGSARSGAHRPPVIEVVAIGMVESSLTDLASAPKQGDENSPDAWLVLAESVLGGLDGFRPGAEIVVLTWLDRARRDVLVVHPKDDIANPERVCSPTRSADRPNSVGLHLVQIVSIQGNRTRVRNLEALDGTPVIEMNPGPIAKGGLDSAADSP